MRGRAARSASDSLSGVLTMPPTSRRHWPRVASSHVGTVFETKYAGKRWPAAFALLLGTLIDVCRNSARSSVSFFRSASASRDLADLGPTESQAARNAAPAAPPWAGRLTEREATVLRLMADGLSNTEISERLHVGSATTKTHVAGVLAKIGVRDRTQAVIAAYESGFVRARHRP